MQRVLSGGKGVGILPLFENCILRGNLIFTPENRYFYMKGIFHPIHPYDLNSHLLTYTIYIDKQNKYILQDVQKNWIPLVHKYFGFYRARHHPVSERLCAFKGSFIMF